MHPIYKFELAYSGTTSRSYPVYSASLAKDWTKETGEKFFRETLNGELTFCGPDYATIMAQSFGTVFGLEIKISQDGGTLWQSYWKGEFTMTDCKIDEDRHTISVTPTPVDKYTAIMRGLEKEFDIVKLTPAMEKVTLDKRPMLQVYRAGENVIGNYLGGMWWEQDCERIYDATELQNTYRFREISYFIYADIQGHLRGSNLNNLTLAGQYPTQTDTYSLSGSGYTFEQRVESGYIFLYVHPTGDDSRGWKSVGVGQSSGSTIYLGDNITLYAYGWPDPTDSLLLTVRSAHIFARIITDASTYGGADTYPLPYNDMAGMRGIYKNGQPYGDSNLIYFSVAKTTTPTEWGLYWDDLYYASPTGLSVGGEAFPMARNSWDASAVWFISPAQPIDYDGVTQYTIKDAYPLDAIISKLLSQIAPTLTFTADILHSMFLYGGSEARIAPYFSYLLFLTPKSNALGSGYDTPAMKGSLTLRQVFDMLRDCFRCYWYIDGTTTLRIEHTKFFDNGLSYSGASVGADLTTLTCLKNGKPWGWNTSKYTFDKLSLPARYEFAWMDEVTRAFIGQPIDILSPYVQENDVEQVQVQNFTTDVDYMRSNPGGCSKDGWALLCGSAQQNGGYKVPYYVTELSDIEYNLQNGPLSFIYLQRYYLYDLPARSYRIGADEGTALGVKKPKVQEVIYPAKNDPDPMRLVKTPLGNGTVGKMSVNLSSRTVNVTLNYAAE